MSLSRRSAVPRIIVGLLFAGLLSAGGGGSAATGRESGGAAFERCAGCPGCEAGACDHAPEPGHDHCCAAACWGHTAWLLRAPGSVAEPPSQLSRPIAPSLVDLEQRPDPVFHPPRS